VVSARKLLKNIKKAKKGVEKALQPPYKIEWLKKAVEFCMSINFTSFDAFAVCNAIRQSVVTARAMLEDGKAKKDQALLEQALHFCYDTKNFNGHKYKCTLEAECKELLERVTWVNKETVKGIKECEEQQVRAVVAEAAAVGMRNKDIDHLRKLVKGDYGKFLAEQFKKAKKCRHHDRAVRVSIKLKDRELEGKLATFEFATWGGLKDPMAWSSESFTWGSTSKRAANMLRWQSAHLHSPITRAAAQVPDPTALKALAVKITNGFDTVQKFMGERNTLKMPFRLSELLTDAIVNDPMRDEVYLHIIKQCTVNGPDTENQRNPSWRPHVGRGVELMALCTLAFPPSAALENFVEAWIRRPELAAFEQKFNLRGLLRRRLYHGAIAAGAVPSEGEFAPQCRMDGKRYGDGATVAVFEKHLRLDAFKEPKGKRGSSGDRGPSPSKKEKKGTKSKKKTKSVSSVENGGGVAAAAAPAAASPAPSMGQWEQAVDPSTGKVYFYNTETKETRWEAPESTA